MGNSLLEHALNMVLKSLSKYDKGELTKLRDAVSAEILDRSIEGNSYPILDHSYNIFSGDDDAST